MYVKPGLLGALESELAGLIVLWWTSRSAVCWSCQTLRTEQKRVEMREKTCLILYANNKDADQPAHPPSLISIFTIRCLDSIIPVVGKPEISQLYLHVTLLFLSRPQFESYLVANSQRQVFSWGSSTKNSPPIPHLLQAQQTLALPSTITQNRQKKICVSGIPTLVRIFPPNPKRLIDELQAN